MSKKEKFWSWMSRRNGPDVLFFVSLCVFALFLILGAVLFNLVLLLIGILPLGYAAFRFFSGNLPSRRAESLRFVRIITAPWRLAKRLIDKMRRKKKKSNRSLDDFIYCSCPSCTAPLRLKRQTGEYTVTCPKCANKFPIHIR